MSNFDSLMCNDIKLEVDQISPSPVGDESYSNDFDYHEVYGKYISEANHCDHIPNSQSTDSNMNIIPGLSLPGDDNDFKLANQLRLSTNKTRVVRNVYEGVAPFISDSCEKLQFKSQQCCVLGNNKLHLCTEKTKVSFAGVGQYIGTTFDEFTYCVPEHLNASMKRIVINEEKFSSQSNFDIMFDHLPSCTQEYLSGMTRLLDLVDRLKLSGAYNSEHLRVISELGSSLYISFKLLATDCSIDNVIAVFINMFAQLKLPTDLYNQLKLQLFAAVKLLFASVNTFYSQSTDTVKKVRDTLSQMFGFIDGIADDKIWEVLASFVAKISALWVSTATKLRIDSFTCEGIKNVVEHLQTLRETGQDVIQMIFDGYLFIVDNLDRCFNGDFSFLLLGSRATKVFESRVSRLKTCCKLLALGDEDLILSQHGLTLSDFDTEIEQLLAEGEVSLKKAKDVQRQAIKRMMDEIYDVQRMRIHLQNTVNTKPTPFGIAIVGPTAVGKSHLVGRLSKTLLVAAGEQPNNNLIVTGVLSEKFDSTITRSHKVIVYDDVANSTAGKSDNGENYDKLLNAINPQARPLLKSESDEKGKVYPSNVACILTTNVPWINALEKSKCADSICRRFTWVEMKIKDDLDVCVPNTRRLDPKRSLINGEYRDDLWEFTLWSFITFDNIALTPEMIAQGCERKKGAIAQRIKWTDKPLKEQTMSDFLMFIGNMARDHLTCERKLSEHAKKETKLEYCDVCCIPCNTCPCKTESQFLGIERDQLLVGLADTREILVSWYSNMLNTAKFYAVLRVMIRKWPTYFNFACTTTLLFIPLIIYLLLCMKLNFVTLLVSGCFSFILIWSMSIWAIYKDLLRQISTVPGALSFFAEESKVLMRNYANSLIAGSALITMVICVYNAYKPKSQFWSYKDTIPETMVASTKRSEISRTTTVDALTPLIKRDLGVLTVKTVGRTNQCLVFPIKSNFFLTVNHMLPTDGEVMVSIEHEDGAVKTVANQLIPQIHIKRLIDKDLAIIYVPSAVPRKCYLGYFPGDIVWHETIPAILITKDLETRDTMSHPTKLVRYGSYLHGRRITTDQAIIHNPYEYELRCDTKCGMCTSVLMDYDRAIIYGFHVAGRNHTGMMSMICRKDIDGLLSSFDVFNPVSRSSLYMGSNILSHGLGLISSVVTDDSVNLPIDRHNLVCHGVIEGAGATFKDPFKKTKFFKEVVKEFGNPTYGPPQEINSVYHKRKALSKLAQPCQNFPFSKVEAARQDYIQPIFDCIDQMSDVERLRISKSLSINEALDGIGITCLSGLDNSTSVGFPFRGKKKDFLERDAFDPNIPKHPRELIINNGVDMRAEVECLRKKYLNGESSGAIFKASMKSNELLPLSKVKARVFMGCNFPFLILCRMTFAPFIRLVEANKNLFEAAVGTDMNSIQAEEMFKHLTRFDREHIVALDYAAFDQTMSAQVSTAASKVIIDILRRCGCNDDEIKVATGLLTDINYPVIHYFGVIIQLANSNPSGQPLTTHLNGIVNSLYLRIFFNDIYPNILGRVKYRDCVVTLTYGDDNINGVHPDYHEFNGVNIVQVGQTYGLKITMAAKDDEIVPFTDIYNSGFLKRNFRFDDSIGHIVASMEKTSIVKAIHWYKKDSPQSEETAFSDKADGMMRNARYISREYFEEIKSKLRRVADNCNIADIIVWYDYDELSKQVKDKYYTNYRPGHYYDDFEFDSQSNIETVCNVYDGCDRRYEIIHGNLTEIISLVDTNTAINIIDTEINEVRQLVILCKVPILLNQFKQFLRRLYIALEPCLLGVQYREFVRAFLEVVDYDMLLSCNHPDNNYGVPFVNGIVQYTSGPYTSQSLTVPIVAASIVIKLSLVCVLIGILDTIWMFLKTFSLPFVRNLGDICTVPISLAYKYLLPLVSSSGIQVQVDIYREQLRYIRVGRSIELGLDERQVINEVEEYLKYIEVLMMTSICSPYCARAFSMAHKELSTMLTDIALETTNELIRAQPFAMAFIGRPGVGKTALALALSKDIMDEYYTFDMKNVVIMNETDEYQSEFRTNHDVVIFDDVSNARPDCSDTINPTRKLIDFINNVPKSAISPFLELKGIVKIRPKLVVVTSNASQLDAGSYSVSPQSIYRRFVTINVDTIPDATIDHSSLTFTHLRFTIAIPEIAQPYCQNGQYTQSYHQLQVDYDSNLSEHYAKFYGPTVGAQINKARNTVLSYDQLKLALSELAGTHYAQQDSYLTNVNNYLTKFKSQSKSIECDSHKTLKDIYKGKPIRIDADYGDCLIYSSSGCASLYIVNSNGWQQACYIKQLYNHPLSLGAHYNSGKLGSYPILERIYKGMPLHIDTDYGGCVLYTVHGNQMLYIANRSGWKQACCVKQLSRGHISLGAHYNMIQNKDRVIIYMSTFFLGIWSFISQCFLLRKWESQSETVSTPSSMDALLDYYTDRRINNTRALHSARQHLVSTHTKDMEYDLYLSCLKGTHFSSLPVVREWTLRGQPCYKGDLVIYDSFYDVFLVIEYKRELKLTKLLHQLYRSTSMFTAVSHAKEVIMVFYTNTSGLTYANHIGKIDNILTILRFYNIAHDIRDNMLHMPAIYNGESTAEAISELQITYNLYQNMQPIRTITI